MLTIKSDRRFVGERPVSVMFDIGANVFGTHKRSVPKAAYIGKYVKCRTFSGRVEPLCRMFIRNPYYSCYDDLCSLRKPIADVIVGQLKDVRYLIVNLIVHRVRFRHGNTVTV